MDSPTLQAEDYLSIARCVFPRFKKMKFSLHGMEPLEGDAVPLTYETVATACAWGIPTSLVTNGTNLTAHARDLSSVLSTLIVSLNSADERCHDKTRGTNGAYQQTCAGIEAAVSHFGPERIVINAILFPHTGDRLYGLPQLLHSWGLKTLYVNPLIRFSGQEIVPLNVAYVAQTMLALADRCERYDITLVVSDEMGLYQFPTEFHQRVRVMTLNDFAFVRVLPSGAVSTLRDMVKPADQTLNVWDRKESFSHFLERIFDDRLAQRSPLARIWDPIAHCAVRRFMHGIGRP